MYILAAVEFPQWLNYPGLEAWKFFNLAVFIGAMIFLLRRKISEALGARREAIKQELVQAQQQREQAMTKVTEAEALLGKTLESWVTAQRNLNPPLSSIDADVAEIRQVVFRPLGDLPIYRGSGWNAFKFPATLPRFILVRADVAVKTSDGQVVRHTVYQRFPDLDHVLLLKSDELSVLVRLLPTIGGTKRRAWTNAMETPNQPVGDSMQILALFGRFFEARPGHWGGWELETYPHVTQIEFVNAERTKANANVTLGYSGATVVLEKVDGKWRAVRLTNQWIT